MHTLGLANSGVCVTLRLQSVPQSTLAPLFLPGSAHQRAMRPGTGQVAVMHYIAKPELLNVLPAAVTTLTVAS